MRPEFCGLFKILFPHALIKIAKPDKRQHALLWLYIDSVHLPYLYTVLRYHSFFYGARAIDTNGYEINDAQSTSSHTISVVNIFAIPTWRLKLCIISSAASYKMVWPASKHFPGCSWGEREVSELLGLNFKDKPDARRLMLDYALDGHPLRKSFPAIGFEELEYNALERSLKYNPLRFRDEIDF